MQKDQKSLAFLSESLQFPNVEMADNEGLLAVGGDLSVERLILAYENGIFPWFNEGSAILWWSPDPRMVLFPKNIKISRGMRKVLKRSFFRLTMNTCFDEVVYECATIRRAGQEGTWITTEMRKAYSKLYELGFAKSYEVWQDTKLVGGLYGIDLGHVFCGESMFSEVSNASKFAFIKIAQELEAKKYSLIDCQMNTPHLASLGAEEIPRADFIKILKAKNQ